jgi:DNA-binding CsgD family transcriptional regulator/pimeloyl-ACP methyl ester carboxylesterase
VPSIQYVHTPDDVSIAYWSMGSGNPVVDMGTPPFSHLQLEWELPELRAWYERFASRHQLIRYDGRGTGVSTRDIDSYSLEGMVLDLETVVDRLDLPPFTLIGAINSGLPAITFAARRPERLRRLILWCAYSRGSDYFEDTGTLALRGIVDQDWPMFTQVAAHSRFSWAESDVAIRFAGLIRRAVTPKVQAMLMDVLRFADVTALLPRISTPTLVLQREARGGEIARTLATSIPDARVVLLEGGSAAPYLADADTVWQTMSDFIDSARVRDYGGLLTQREVEVIGLIAAGKTNLQIAAELVISHNTVQRHVSNILAKTGASNRTEAARFARRDGMSPVAPSAAPKTQPERAG